MPENRPAQEHRVTAADAEPATPSSAAQRPLDAITSHPWLAALAVLALLLLILVLVWDWNWFKGPVERQVEARTGRSFEIGGNLDVKLGWSPLITADSLRLGNAEWAEKPTMATVDRLAFRIELRPLLTGDVRISELRLNKPLLNLEKGPQGEGNWDFGNDDDKGEPAQFRRVWIEDGRLQFLDAAEQTDIDIAVASIESTRPGGAPPVAVDGGGVWQGNDFKIEGRAESPLELQDSEQPYRLDLRATAGATRAHARGSLVDPLRLRDFDLQLELAGDDLGDLYPLIGIATPPTPPYVLDGRFTREDTVWRYDDFTGEIGDSDIAGDANVDTSGERPYLRADLSSKLLDLDDLAGFIGGTPRSNDEEPVPTPASGRVFPDTPYELDRLRAMDADVRLRAQRIDAPGWPIEDMDAHLLLEGGVVRLDPLNFGIADGEVRSTIQMDAREDVIRTRVDLGASGMNLSKLLPAVELAKDAVGKVGGKVALSGSGNSIARMLGSSDGDVAFGMGRGEISNLLMEYAGLDLAEIIKFKLTEDQQIPVRCAFGDFAVKNGVMNSRALAFDTSDTILIGEGQVNLRDETLDLLIRPRPKDRSLLSLRSPLTVDGTFRDPSIRPDFKRVGLRGALALALGTIAPPAALLATLELGPGEDSSCGGRYAE